MDDKMKYNLSCSKNSNVLHHIGCKYDKMIKNENKILYENMFKAYDDNADYVVCKLCNKVFRQYKKEKEVIDKFCIDNDFKYILDDNGCLYIKSKLDYWKIYAGVYTNDLLLWHANYYNPKGYYIGRNGFPVFTYHRQNENTTYYTIMEIFECIKQHDYYVGESYKHEKRNSKKGKAARRKAKKANQKAKVRNTIREIERVKYLERRKSK